jgi:small redox-active disulfide protein 2
MNVNDISQIKVGSERIGIIGLKQALEDVAGICGGMGDDRIKTLLLENLGKKNYIPSSVKGRYETAFFREFCRFTGRAMEPEAGPGVLEIKVLGQGCGRCDQLERDVMGIVSELKIAADIEHVRDIKAIAGYGVLGTPALLVGGQVKAVGTVPSKAKITAWIKEAAENTKKE